MPSLGSRLLPPPGVRAAQSCEFFVVIPSPMLPFDHNARFTIGISNA
jgi:hypothetical protein